MSQAWSHHQCGSWVTSGLRTMSVEITWTKGGMGSLFSSTCFTLTHICLFILDFTFSVTSLGCFSISCYTDHSWRQLHKHDSSPGLYLFLWIHMPLELEKPGNVLNAYFANSITHCWLLEPRYQKLVSPLSATGGWMFTTKALVILILGLQCLK